MPLFLYPSIAWPTPGTIKEKIAFTIASHSIILPP